MKLTGIYRGTKFSPNHIANDEKIFLLAARNLEVHGTEIEFISESDFLKNEVKTTFIFTMARDKKAVARLRKLEQNGARIVNSGTGIENCYRINMTRKLVDNGIPYPESVIISTDDDNPYHLIEPLANQGLWIKRGDFHAIHQEDVVYVPDVTQAIEMLEEFSRRGIDEVVVSRHLKGDLVKFYAVRGTDFFYWFYPHDHQHVKYPNEQQVDSNPVHGTFSIDRLRREANRAAALLDVDIYGGDAIVAQDGSFHIIDFNDWPSFAPCRTEAAPFIAKRILERCTESALVPEAH